MSFTFSLSSCRNNVRHLTGWLTDDIVYVIIHIYAYIQFHIIYLEVSSSAGSVSRVNKGLSHKHASGEKSWLCFLPLSLTDLQKSIIIRNGFQKQECMEVSGSEQ